MSHPMKKATEQSKCRSCGAPILWCITRNAKNMPVDARPVAEGAMVLTLQGGEYGKLLAEKFYPPKHASPPRNRYDSHWATCPNAESHRGGGAT